MRFVRLASIWVLFCFGPVISQTSDERSGFPEKKESDMEVLSPGKEMGLLKSSAVVSIKIYQKMISSQDVPSCKFSPSCSNFGVQSIQRYGVLRGILLTGDRLLRCNPFVGSGHYAYDGEKFQDPVSDYSHRR